jgi:hypothetical protein
LRLDSTEQQPEGKCGHRNCHGLACSAELKQGYLLVTSSDEDAEDGNGKKTGKNPTDEEWPTASKQP